MLGKTENSQSQWLIHKPLQKIIIDSFLHLSRVLLYRIMVYFLTDPKKITAYIYDIAFITDYV